MGKRFFNKLNNGFRPKNNNKNRFNNNFNNKKSIRKQDGNKVDKPKVEPINYAVKAPLFDKSKLVSTWKIERKIGPGLVNGSNTCFLNSVLECLTYTPPLAQYFLKERHSPSCKLRKEGFCALCAMETHIDRCFKEPKSFSKHAAILPRYFTSNLRSLSKTLRLGRQEDAHELYMFILSAMQKASTFGLGKLPPKVEETAFIHQVFGGKLRSQLKCYSCKATSNNYEACLDLSVDLNNKADTLEKALDNFTKVDIIGGDDPSNRYKCDSCKQMVKAGKQMTVFELPLMMTVHLKRFAFDLERGYMRKIMTKVKYPKTLEMAPYVSKEVNIERAPYDLYAVLVHHGYGCDSGHYYAYVKSPAGKWYLADDDLITPVSEDEVLGQDAYMLFYQQKKPVMKKSAEEKKMPLPKSPSPPPAIHEPTPEKQPPVLIEDTNKNKKKKERRVVFEPLVHSDSPASWIMQSSDKPHRSLRGNLSPPTFSANVQDDSAWIVSSPDAFKKRLSEKKRRKIRVKLESRKSRWHVQPY